MTKKVVIVGAGPGGLSSAILLATAGCHVTVLEARGRVGGRSSSHEESGYRFDTGPTFFLYPEVLRSIFAAAGRSLDDEVDLVRLDPMYRVLYGDGTTIDATDDLPRMAKSIAAISEHDGRSVERFFAENAVKFDRFVPFLQQPFEGLKSLLDPKLMALLPTLAPWRQLDKELERYFDDPRVRMMFSFQALYLGMTPQRCPSLFSILPYIEYKFGVFHPRGGCGEIMEAMARVAIDLGVDLRLGESARRVQFKGKQAVAVETDRERLPCDAAVINADFATAMRTLVPDHLRRRWSDRKLAKSRYSCSTFMLYLGLKGTQDHLPHHTIYVPEDYGQSLRDLDNRQQLNGDPPFYVQNAAVTDASLAPKGNSTLYMLLPVANEDDDNTIDWQKEQPRYRKLAIEQLAKAGFKDLDRRIVVERCITPANWRDDFNVYRGATFNLTHNMGQMLNRRPCNRLDDLEHVYLVGGGTHPGSGLPTIFESAKISTRLLCADLGLRSPLPEDVDSEPASVEPSTLVRTMRRAERYLRGAA